MSSFSNFSMCFLSCVRAADSDVTCSSNRCIIKVDCQKLKYHIKDKEKASQSIIHSSLQNKDN